MTEYYLKFKKSPVPKEIKEGLSKDKWYDIKIPVNGDYYNKTDGGDVEPSGSFKVQVKTLLWSQLPRGYGGNHSDFIKYYIRYTTASAPTTASVEATTAGPSVEEAEVKRQDSTDTLEAKTEQKHTTQADDDSKEIEEATTQDAKALETLEKKRGVEPQTNPSEFFNDPDITPSLPSTVTKEQYKLEENIGEEDFVNRLDLSNQIGLPDLSSINDQIKASYERQEAADWATFSYKPAGGSFANERGENPIYNAERIQQFIRFGGAMYQSNPDDEAILKYRSGPPPPIIRAKPRRNFNTFGNVPLISETARRDARRLTNRNPRAYKKMKFRR